MLTLTNNVIKCVNQTTSADNISDAGFAGALRVKMLVECMFVAWFAHYVLFFSQIFIDI